MDRCATIVYALKTLRFDADIDELLKFFEVKSLPQCDELIYHLIPRKSSYLAHFQIPSYLVNELILYGEDEIFMQQKDFNMVEAIYFAVLLNKLNLVKVLVNDTNALLAMSIASYYRRTKIINYLQQQTVEIQYTEFYPTLNSAILCRDDNLFREFLLKDLNVFTERRPVNFAIFSYLRDNDVSLMEYVIAYRYTSGLKIMIDLGCPINHNAFHLACQIKHTKIIKILLTHAEDLPQFTERFILQYLPKSDFDLYCRFLS